MPIWTKTWYYKIDNDARKRIYDVYYLADLIRNKELTSESYVYCDDMDDWKNVQQTSLWEYFDEGTRKKVEAEKRRSSKKHFLFKKDKFESALKKSSKKKPKSMSFKNPAGLSKKILLTAAVCSGIFGGVQRTMDKKKPLIVVDDTIKNSNNKETKSKKKEKKKEAKLQSYTTLYTVNIYKKTDKNSKAIARTVKGEIITIIKTKKDGNIQWGQLETGNWLMIKDENYIYMELEENES